jgi:hypothetical protein
MTFLLQDFGFSRLPTKNWRLKVWLLTSIHKYLVVVCRLKFKLPISFVFEDLKMTVQHIVMIEFKDGTSDEAITEALNAVGGLKDKIEGVLEVQSGKDFSGRAGNFTHGIIVRMRDKDVLSAYGPHPAHKEVQGLLGPIVETLWVIDFETT